MLMVGRVQMLHQPLGDAKPLRLESRELAADVEETGGLESWLAERGGSVRLRDVRADGDVRVLWDKRLILTDHARYHAQKQELTLDADAGQLVELIQDTSSPVAQTAKRFRSTWRATSSRSISPARRACRRAAWAT